MLLHEQAGKATAAARLFGNKRLEAEIVNDLVRQEIVAIYDAASELGIIKLSPKQREFAINAALTHAHKGLGLNPTRISKKSEEPLSGKAG